MKPGDRYWMAHPKRHDDLRALAFLALVILVLLAASCVPQGSIR